MNTPSNLSQVLARLSSGDARVLAGGTDLFTVDWHTDQSFVDVSRIPELKVIEEHQNYWRIGASVTWAELSNAGLPSQFDGLVSAGNEIGSIQIQNSATIAGNICNASPAADGTPMLFALNAEVEIASNDTVSMLPIEQFVLGPRSVALGSDQLLLALRIPKFDSNTGGNVISRFQKLGSRKYLVISFVSVSVVISIESNMIKTVGIAIGSCSPVPCRLPALESKLLGQSTDADWAVHVTDEDLSTLSPIDDKRASANYRLSATKTLLQRVLVSLREQTS